MEVGTVAMETKPAVGDGKEGYHPEQQSSADPLAELGFNSFVACGTLGSVDLLATAPQLEEPVSYPELRNVVLDTGQQRLITNCEASKQRMTPEDGLSTPPLQPDTTLELESGMGSGAESDPIRCEDCGNEFRGMAEYYQHRCTLEEDDDEDGGDEEDEDKMTTSGSAGRNVAALSYCTDQRFTLPTTSSSSMVMSMSNAAAAAAAISSSGSTLKAYRPRESSATDRDGAFHDYDSVGSSPSDVETFDGKIVYNPDGSAYIIDVGETEGSDDEISLDLPRHEGSVVDGRGVKSPSSVRPIPPIVNAFHVSRNPTLYSAMYGQAYANLLQEKKKVPEVPIMLSYRVYSVRDKSSYCTDEGKENETNVDPNTRPGFSDLETTKPKFPSFGCSSVPVKPILMCFICKLSFGNSKSFVAHALGEHSMSLNEEEKSLMDRRNTSAIVQGVGKDKVPLLSFLEPVPPSDSRDCNEQFFAQTVNTSCASSLSGCDAATVAAVAASFASSMASTTNATFTGTTSATQTSPTFTTCTSNSSPSGSCFGLQAKKGLHPSTLVIPSSPVTANRRSPERSPLSQHRRASVTSQVNDGDREDLDEEFESGQNLALKEDVDVPLQCSSKLRNARKKCNIRVPDRLNDALSHLSHYGGSSLDIRKSPIASSISPLNNDRQSGDICNPPPSISPLASSASPASSQAFPNLSHSPSAATAAHTPVSSTVALNLTGGSPLGICTDHPNGRLSGVECPKCDMILGSSRSLGGHMTMMHSRNSCKTLKCPKCNWHYKYQETLEIHMKEKHPENETTCIYCITNQPHPRLARGETYTCGYKPYRCDVCNYSTTTKGNLSIHMQSDKHLNNMQELQNGGMSTEGLTQTAGMGSSPTAPSAPTASSPSVTPNQKPKPKPTWRCDVCNYETNVARNLRIHMTSEKHTHNMMVLQQNVKHMQQLSAFQAQAAQALDPALLQFHPGLTLPGDKPPPHTEAALADMAYNQALLIQLMTGGQLGQMPELPLDVGLQALQESLAAVAAAGGSGVSSLGSGMVPATSPGSSVAIPSPGMTPGGHMPLDEPNTDPTKLFQCCVCSVYGCDSVELLSQHLQQDRTKQREHEILMVMAGNYVCKLCSYKTNLKANFQLHCKTDKHLQRLQHINHIKEGGLSNEWKLKYLNVSNPIQVKCNACNYYTNSTHKLQLHVANPRHELDARLFRHLQTCDLGMAADTKYYHCALCSFSTRTKVALIQHVHSIRHMRCESLRQLHQSKNSAKDHDDDFADIFHVRELADGEIVSFDVESAGEL